MKKPIFYLTMAMIGLLSLPCVAHESNPLIGQWRWSSPDCGKPDFIFSETKFIHNFEADGTGSQAVFNEVKYEVFGDKVIANVNKNHGFGKTPEKTKITFKIVDKNHFIMDRKTKSMNDIFRCP